MKEKETKTIIKIIFAWDDEKEEKWLEEMSIQGWQLDKVAPYIYTFKRCQPVRMIYRLDFRSDFDKGYQEYQSLFKDAGWELIARFSGWHYYRIAPENNEMPEIYNSNKAKAEKYRRLLAVALIPFLFCINAGYRTFSLDDASGSNILNIGFEVFFVAMVAFIVYAIFRLWKKIKDLESNSKE